MIKTVSNLNSSINVLKSEAMEIKSRIAETDSIIELTSLCEELQQVLNQINSLYKEVSELEIVEVHKRSVINFWLSKWDYISMFDAIKEANPLYKGVLTIRQLKEAYKTIEEYQL